MRIKILFSAVEDLHTGRLFYEKQGAGLGEYFFNSLFGQDENRKAKTCITQRHEGTKENPRSETGNLCGLAALCEAKSEPAG